MEAFLASSQEIKREIWKIYNITENEVEARLLKLTKWVNKKKPPLPPKIIDETFLQTALLRNKFDLEKTKKSIDNYFKCIAKYPEIFEKIGINIKPSKENCYVVGSPKLAPKYERIAILKFSPRATDYRDFDIDRCFLTAITQGAPMVQFDYVSGIRVIFDFDYFTVKHVLKVTPSMLMKLLYFHENMLKLRLGGIEILNAPNIVNVVLKLAKLVMKPKLFERITVHESYESLYKNVPRDCLPSDYGGDLGSIQDWLKVMDESVDLHKSLYAEIRRLAKIEREEQIKKNNLIHDHFIHLAID